MNISILISNLYDEKVAERVLNKGMRNLFNRIFGNDERIEELIEAMTEKQKNIAEIKTALNCEIKRLDEKITGLITFFGILVTIITMVISVHLHDIDKRFENIDKRFDDLNSKTDIQILSVQKQIDTMQEDIKEIKEILIKKKK